MAHVGVEGFAAGDGEDDAAEDDDALEPVVHEVVDGVVRRQGFEHAGILQDVEDAEPPDEEEPHGHDRAKQLAQQGGAALLNGEQAHEDRDGDAEDDGLGNVGLGDEETLHGGEHRDGGRDGAVCVQRSTANDDEHRQPGQRLARGGPVLVGKQGPQGHDAAFATVVGAHDERDVLEGHHHGHRPEDQAQDLQDVRWRDDPVTVVQDVGALLDRVQGAGTDVAEDDADSADGQSNQLLAADFASMAVAVITVGDKAAPR